VAYPNEANAIKAARRVLRADAAEVSEAFLIFPERVRHDKISAPDNPRAAGCAV
jgi:hypothetical protein